MMDKFAKKLQLHKARLSLSQQTALEGHNKLRICGWRREATDKKKQAKIITRLPKVICVVGCHQHESWTAAVFNNNFLWTNSSSGRFAPYDDDDVTQNLYNLAQKRNSKRSKFLKTFWYQKTGNCDSFQIISTKKKHLQVFLLGLERESEFFIVIVQFLFAFQEAVEEEEEKRFVRHEICCATPYSWVLLRSRSVRAETRKPLTHYHDSLLRCSICCTMICARWCRKSILTTCRLIHAFYWIFLLDVYVWERTTGEKYCESAIYLEACLPQTEKGENTEIEKTVQGNFMSRAVVSKSKREKGLSEIFDRYQAN